MFRNYLCRPDELVSPKECELSSHRSAQTIRLWASRYQLGLSVAGRWLINRVALRLFLEGENEALRAFRDGDHGHPAVLRAYRAEGLKPPAAAEVARA